MASILNFVYFMIFVHFLFLVLTEANSNIILSCFINLIVLPYTQFFYHLNDIILLFVYITATNCTSIADCASKICALPSVVWCLSHSNTCICL